MGNGLMGPDEKGNVNACLLETSAGFYILQVYIADWPPITIGQCHNEYHMTLIKQAPILMT